MSALYWRVREEDLIVRELGEELLIYDLRRHRAYCLNRAAALIWRLADGRTSVREMARRVERELSLPQGEDVVLWTLARLSQAGLIHPPLSIPGKRLTRRQLVQRLGLTGGMLVALPTIRAVVAPTRAQVLTCVRNCQGVPDCTPCQDQKGRCRKRCWRGQCVDHSAVPQCP